MIEAIKQDLIAVYQTYSTNSENPIDSGICNLNSTDKKKLHQLHVATSKLMSFKSVSLVFSSAIKCISTLDIKSPIFEIGSGYLLGLPKDTRLTYDFHQETNYMRGYENLYQCHYPLLRISESDNGTMSLLDKSHKLGPLDFEKK